MKKGLTRNEFHDAKYSNYKSMDENKYYIFKVYDLLKKIAKKGQKSLDIGCADGSFSKKIHDELGLITYGIDISTKALETAKKNGVVAVKHDLEQKLPYPDGFFDIVFACEVVEHIYDTDFFISELRRVLKKGGTLILSTPNLASLVNRIKLLFGKYPTFVPEYRTQGAGHIRAYTVPILRKQLISHGMRISNVVSPNITFPMVNRAVPKFLKKIAYRLGDYFPNIGSHMIIVSRK